MTATAVRTTTDSRSVPGDLRACLNAEQRAVAAEAEAFDAFVDRIREIEAEPPVPSGVRGIAHRSGGSGLRRVETAYAETVMSVSHYDTDYGDTYRESVVTEFGPEVGVALADGRRFQPHLKRAVIGTANSCRADRESFLETLEIESESLSAVEDALRGIEQELREFESGSASTRGYGALEAEWRRLGVIAEELTRVSTTRQRAIIRQRREFVMPSEAPDTPTYLYDEFDDDYPVLSVCVRLHTRVQRCKSDRERELAGV
ncbi:hypothetical protein GCM10008995_24470 [Halobellus salinus]|uniref:DUF7260 domain-containing protein n=1 Tax=Halobellus salinus TaxID=931585 RepID=A0A830ECY8_9EURY|nr:hypothetical protein [Halobellus salinus]GGJ13707.1 hypothetical protein GCM10008995_24470 [Halobellus salinus]SMP30949.1 hypothetical protein SAMN06265347_11724 [Halobellus salinus]